MEKVNTERLPWEWRGVGYCGVNPSTMNVWNPESDQITMRAVMLDGLKLTYNGGNTKQHVWMLLETHKRNQTSEPPDDAGASNKNEP